MARILIVDDSAFTRRQLKKLLFGLGHEVIEAENGTVGLQCLEAHTPDYIVTDLLMPVMNGFDFIQAIRKRSDELRKTPVIVLSADVQDASRSRTAQLGAQYFLGKPVRADSLRNALEEIANNAQAAG